MAVGGLTVGTAARFSAVVGILVYTNSLNLKLCFDDSAAIEDNEDLRANVSWMNLLHNDFWGVPMDDRDSHKSYRPLTVATFRLNYMLHELQPLGYHLVNVLLHSAVCYLYVLLCGVVFSEVWPALIAGLLFAVHPIHTEAISGLVGRADILAGLFYIGSIFAYKQHLSSGKKRWLVLSLLLVLCSTLSKEIGITTVAICLLYELLIHRKMNIRWLTKILSNSGKGKKSSSINVQLQWFKLMVIHACILGCFTIVILYFRFKLNKTPPIFSAHNNPALKFPTPLRQLHWSYLCVLNVWLLLSPSQLCAEYAMDTIPPIAFLTDPRNLLTLATFVTLLSMTCYAMSTRDGHHRKLLFGLCLMSIPFLPASNLFFPVGFVIAERVLYIPSMGFCMIVAYGAWRLLSNTKRATKLLCKLLVLYLILIHGIKTLVRNPDWHNSYNLYSSSVRTLPNNAKMWRNLGTESSNLGYTNDSEIFFRRSIAIEPNFITGYMNLAYLLKGLNRTEEAIETYREAAEMVTAGLSDETSAINVSPKDVKVYTILANMLREYPDSYWEAYELSLKAVEQEPKWEESHNMMGNCLMKLQRFSDALDAFKKAVKLKPDYAIAHSNLGHAHQEVGGVNEAELHYREALRLDVNHTLTKFRLAQLISDMPHKTLARLLEADALLEQVLAEDPGNGNATFCRALVHYDLKNYTLTEELFHLTLDITPNHSGALYNLGVLYTEIGRFSECVEILSELRGSDPTHLQGYSQLGTCHMKLKDYQQAHEAFTGILEIDPDNTMALQNYGIMLIELKQNQLALDVFLHLSRLYPEDKSYTQQVEVLQQHIEKRSLRDRETKSKPAQQK